MTDSRRLISYILAMSATGWVLLVVAGPLLASTSASAGGWLYAVGALICHQQPERSFHVGTSQLPVCARCLGLYGGAALGLIAWALTAHRRRAPWMASHAMITVAVSGAPTMLTILTAWIGVGDPSNPWRAALAVPLGAAGGLVSGAVATDHLK
jgi:uncharacterized membrane protein